VRLSEEMKVVIEDEVEASGTILCTTANQWADTVTQLEDVLVEALTKLQEMGGYQG